MSKRTFQVIVTCRVELEVDDAVIAAVDDSWRKQFHGDIRTPEQIAEFIATVMTKGAHTLDLDQIDGFADQRSDGAKVLDAEWEAEAKEYPAPKRKKSGT